MRLALSLMFALALSLASPGRAQSLEESVIANLERDGYVRIVRTKTLLGRVRIVALRRGHIREVVINPSTSEILRDVEIRSDKVPDIPPRRQGSGDGG